MGNSAAVRYEAVMSLKRELEDLNQQLASVQAVQRQQVEALEHKLQHMARERMNWGAPPLEWRHDEVHLYGATLLTEMDVRVNVGPVIGKVTATTAIVLLEIDRNREIECFVSLQDVACPGGRVVARVKRRMPANAPRAFTITGLSVDQMYKVTFSGLCQKDCERCIGQFKTYNSLSQRVRACVVAGDNPVALEEGDPNVWAKVAARVASFEVDVMIHVGGQVHSSRAFRDAMILFSRHEQAGFVSTGQHEIEEMTREQLRDVYRRCWNYPRNFQILRACSHLMIWSDADVFKDFTIADNGMGDPISPDMIRLAHGVYREYQRQLWDPDCVDTGPAMYGASQANRRSQMLMDAVRKQMLDKAAAAKRDEGGAGDEDDDEEDDILGVSEPDPPAAEHHFHRLGGVGILFLDMRGGRLLERGGQALDNPLVSQKQWRFVEQSLEDPDNTMRVLLVCLERPLVEETVASAKKRSRRPETVSVKERWAYNDHELARMLNMLVSWKLARPHRDVQILCGGLNVGVETLIAHRQSDVVLRQLAVGPITDAVDWNDLPVPMEGWADEKGSFTYEHRRMDRPQRNFALLDITELNPASDKDPHLELRIVGAVERPPRALLGPVVGRVTSTSAIVLLEVEKPGLVTCVLTDVLTRKKFTFMQPLRPRRPHAFTCTGLVPERRYHIHFVGIARWNQHRGAVTTCPTDDNLRGLNLAFVHGDRPDRLGAKDANPWQLLHEQLELPWGGPDMVVHIGAQVEGECYCCCSCCSAR